MVLVRTTAVTKARAAVTEARSQLAAATPDLATAEKLREDTRAGDLETGYLHREHRGWMMRKWSKTKQSSLFMNYPGHR